MSDIAEKRASTAGSEAVVVGFATIRRCSTRECDALDFVDRVGRECVETVEDVVERLLVVAKLEVEVGAIFVEIDDYRTLELCMHKCTHEEE